MKVIKLSLIALVLSSMSVPAIAAAKLGVLFSSYGDIDTPEEAEGYIKAAVLDPDVAPVPNFLRPLIANAGWALLKNATEKEYREIGGSTHYRESSRSQASLVQAALSRNGIEARTYIGFVFTYPHIIDTLSQIQADGVTELVVLNQGAQYSAVTQEINLREVRKYLAQHPEWQVKVIG